MSKAKIQRMIDTAPPSWLEMFKRYKLGRKPTVDRLINTVLEHTPTMRSSGERGKAEYKVPIKVKKEALKGLEMSWKHNYTSASGIGLVRAMQLVVKPKIWERSVDRMKAYFTRHQSDKQGEHFGDNRKPSRGYLAWLVWGGDSGFAWSKRMVGSKQNPRVSKRSLTNPKNSFALEHSKTIKKLGLTILKKKALTQKESHIVQAVQDTIVNDLPKECKQCAKREKRYAKQRKTQPLTGRCSLATQAVWKLLGGLNKGNPKYVPLVIRSGEMGKNSDTHWFIIRLSDGNIIDPTSAQFGRKRIPYEKGEWNVGLLSQHLREHSGTSQLMKEQGIWTPPKCTRKLLEKISMKRNPSKRPLTNPSWKKKRPTTNLTRLKPNQKVILYHGTTLTDAKEMINGFDTNKMVRSHYHSRGYSYRGMYVAPEPLNSFGYVMFKLALRTNNLHGTDFSANITRPSDPQYDKESAAHRKKWSKEMYPDSFRPDLSRTLLQRTEPQALYRGIVSPDMILGVKVRGGDWMTREEFIRAYDADDINDGFDVSSPNYTIDEYLDFIGGGRDERERIIATVHRKMRYDRDPDRRSDNVEKLLNQFDFGFAAQRAFLSKFKRKYGTGVEKNPRRRRNRDTSNIRMPSSWDMPFREGSVVQTIMFSTKHFDGNSARAWLRKHGFKVPKMDRTANYIRYRQFDPKMFNKDSFRTLEFKKGVKAVVGIPKKKFVKNPPLRRNRWEKDSLGHRGAACKRWEKEGSESCSKGSSRSALVRYRATPRGQAAQSRLITRIERSTKGYLRKEVTTASGTPTFYYYIVGINNKGAKYLKRVTQQVAEDVRK
jgi:hypothetical protein